MQPGRSRGRSPRLARPAETVCPPVDDLFWPVFWIAAAIFVLVQGVILVAVFVFRDREHDQEPRQIHVFPRLEVPWTVIPAVNLAAVAVPTVRTI